MSDSIQCYAMPGILMTFCIFPWNFWGIPILGFERMRAAEIPQLRGAVTAAGGQTMLSGTRKVDLLLFFSYGRYSIQHKVGLFCFDKADVKSTYMIWFRYGCGILKDLFMMLSSGGCAGQSPGTGPSSPHIMAAVSGPTDWQQRGRFPSR